MLSDAHNPKIWLATFMRAHACGGVKQCSTGCMEVAVADDNKADSKSILPTSISVLGPAPILEGEDGNAYDELLERVSSDVKPKGIVEEILVQDVVNLTWEILRWRRLKTARLSSSVLKLLSQFVGRRMRRKSKDAKISLLVPEFMPTSPRADKLANKWAAGDPDAVDRVGKLMEAANVTIDLVSADALIDSLDIIERIDHMTTLAEGRRSSILREIDRHRAALAESLRATLKDVEEAEFEIVEPATADVDETVL